MSAYEPVTAERIIGLLEALLVEQRSIMQRQGEALTSQHAAVSALSAIATRQAQIRRTQHLLVSYLLAFGAVAAFVQAWPSLLWLLARN